jgi:hypothetical protein
MKHAAREEELEPAVEWSADTHNTHRDLEKRYGT